MNSLLLSEAVNEDDEEEVGETTPDTLRPALGNLHERMAQAQSWNDEGKFSQKNE